MPRPMNRTEMFDFARQLLGPPSPRVPAREDLRQLCAAGPTTPGVEPEAVEAAGRLLCRFYSEQPPEALPPREPVEQ